MLSANYNRYRVIKPAALPFVPYKPLSLSLYNLVFFQAHGHPVKGRLTGDVFHLYTEWLNKLMICPILLLFVTLRNRNDPVVFAIAGNDNTTKKSRGGVVCVCVSIYSLWPYICVCVYIYIIFYLFIYLFLKSGCLLSLHRQHETVRLDSVISP